MIVGENPLAGRKRGPGGARVVLLLALLAPAARAEDSWWGADKKLHFGYSAAIAGGTYGGAALMYSDRAPRLLWGGSVALAAGIGKEVYDLSGRGDPSLRDLTWDVAGVATGLGVALLIDLTITRLFLQTTPAR